MTNCNPETIRFPTFRRWVKARFADETASSNGEVLLLRQIDGKLGLCEAVAHRLDDIRQRVFGIALGYIELSDPESMRHDPGDAS